MTHNRIFTLEFFPEIFLDLLNECRSAASKNITRPLDPERLSEVYPLEAADSNRRRKSRD